jgi:hypothetical protein
MASFWFGFGFDRNRFGFDWDRFGAASASIGIDMGSR